MAGIRMITDRATEDPETQRRVAEVLERAGEELDSLEAQGEKILAYARQLMIESTETRP